MVFAHCPRLYSGLSLSEEERKQQIKKHVDQISWIRSDAPESAPIRTNDAAALIILQVPPPEKPFKKVLTTGRWDRFISLLDTFVAWRKKPAEAVFENSMVCYGQPYTWAIYKTTRKRRLIQPEFLEGLKEAEKNGFDVQLVLTKRQKLHRPGDAPSITHVITLSLEEFCDKFSSVIDSSVAPL